MNWPASAFRLTAGLCFSVALLFASGCDDPNDIQVNLPNTAAITTDYEEFKAPAATILQDSLETLKADHFLVGRLSDPVLGTTTTRSFLNLQVNEPAANLPARLTGTVLDSTVMVMSFDQVYGNATQPVRFDVFALPQRLDDRASYNANTVLPVGQPIGTNLVSSLTRTRQTKQRQRVAPTVATDTTTRVVDVAVADRTVRLQLSRPGQTPDLVGGIFSALQTESFNQAVLDTRLQGLAVVPTDDFSGTVVGFNRSNDLRIVFYYHDAAAPTTSRTYSIFFGSPPRGDGEAPTSINLNAPRYFTQITTDLSGTGPLARLADPRAAVSSAELNGAAYVQEGSGFGVRLDIPAGLKALKDRKDVAINRAELIIPVRSFTDTLSQPRRLYLYEASANNQVLQSLTNNFRTDRVVLGDNISSTGQRLEAAARFYDLGNNNRYYSVLITNYIQNYIYTQTDATRPATLLLSPTLRTLPTLTLNKAVLDADNITLRVYYSKLR